MLFYSLKFNLYIFSNYLAYKEYLNLFFQDKAALAIILAGKKENFIIMMII